MGAEKLAFHDLGKTEYGIERRAQFMAHGGEKAGFGEICLLGAPAREIAIGLCLFELLDQLVFFRLERECFERGCVEFPGKEKKIDLCGASERDERQLFV